jgi:hypothetical protein
MAIVESRIVATYEFLDIEGKVGTVDVIQSSPFPLAADVLTYFDAVGDAMAAITACNLTGYALTYEYAEDALPAPPVGIEVENSLRLVIDSVGADGNVLTIPGVDPAAAYWTAGNRDVANQANAAIIALIDNLIDGDGTVAPTDERNDDLEADGATGAYVIPQAVKYHRRSQVAGGGRRG